MTFDFDLDDFGAEHEVLPASVDPLQGVAPKQLPALQIEIRGEVVAANIAEFRAEALGVLESINTDLMTDQDFANAEIAVKYCSEVEARITAALDHMMSQAADIDAAQREVEEIREMFRRRRLDLDKLVKSKKQQIKTAMLVAAEDQLRVHLAVLNDGIGRDYMPAMVVDLAGAQKGLKTLRSIQSAVDDEVARAKTEASEIAKKIAFNLGWFLQGFDLHESLFPDLQQLMLKDPEDLKSIVHQRIEQAEADRLEREKRAEQDDKGMSQRLSGTKPMPPAIKEASAPSPRWSADSPPSDDDIVSRVAVFYGVSEPVAQGWLIDLVTRLQVTDAHEQEQKQQWPQERDGTLCDVRGVPWIEDAHSANKTCTTAGEWRARRGMGKERIAQLEAPYLEAKKKSEAHGQKKQAESFGLEPPQDPTDAQTENAQAIMIDIESTSDSNLLAEIEEYARTANITDDARGRIFAAIKGKRRTFSEE